MSATGHWPPELLDDLSAVATDAAAAAVELIHTNRPASFGIDDKSTPTDLVTEMDTASERLIRSTIAARRPQDTVVGEEGGEVVPATTASRDAVTWYVDPIDGTTNYVYDHPGYNVSIAAQVDGVTVVGVVADPTHGRTYRAVAGRGAHCGGQRLRLGRPPKLAHALVATGFAYDPGRRARQAAVVASIITEIRDIRRMGAAALDLCSVAAGRVDAYYERGLSMWDLAAGALVAQEAGARVGTISGAAVEPGSVLAAHPDLFGPLSELLMASDAEEV